MYPIEIKRFPWQKQDSGMVAILDESGSNIASASQMAEFTNYPQAVLTPAKGSFRSIEISLKEIGLIIPLHWTRIDMLSAVLESYARVLDAKGGIDTQRDEYSISGFFFFYPSQLAPRKFSLC